MRRPLLVGTLAAAVIALVASAAVAFGAVGGPSSVPTMTRGGTSLGDRGLLSGPPRAAPNLPGTVVNVSMTNMGGPMMGQSSGMMNGGAMSLSADQASVPHGTVSFFVTNGGSIDHELVILPLPNSHAVGVRPIAAMSRSMRRAVSAKHPNPAVQALATELCRVHQAG